MTTLPTVAVSNHCLDRFLKRFPAGDLVASLAGAVRVSPTKVQHFNRKKRRQSICVRSGNQFWYDAELCAVWVIGVPRDLTGEAELIAVTVLKLRMG
ncbi:hypothetical protein [Fimbriiglobus ruber]|uniref:Uncharacterized protein n=1 Tax=Fimbriiglobus ruber TaxID=1908690 RepID=A0A225CY70_9BACT|nr:hypothetical protein [Fimbriiglobus ruber]OWK34320.1 hypothetical protein FRUB_10291 [Fimbriiglobus ruber]